MAQTVYEQDSACMTNPYETPPPPPPMMETFDPPPPPPPPPMQAMQATDTLSPPATPMYPAAPAKASVFGAMTCPTCGAQMNWQSDHAGSGMRWFGLVGLLMAYPLTAKFRCPQHGIVPDSSLAPAQQSAALIRKLILAASGLGVLGGAIWLFTIWV